MIDDTTPQTETQTDNVPTDEQVAAVEAALTDAPAGSPIGEAPASKADEVDEAIGAEADADVTSSADSAAPIQAWDGTGNDSSHVEGNTDDPDELPEPGDPLVDPDEIELIDPATVQTTISDSSHTGPVVGAVTLPELGASMNSQDVVYTRSDGETMTLSKITTSSAQRTAAFTAFEAELIGPG